MKKKVILIPMLFCCLLTAENILRNGDFEKISADGYISDWKNYYGKDLPPQPFTENAREGKNCLYISSPTSENTKAAASYISEKECSIIPGKKYTLTFFAKAAADGQILRGDFYTYSAIKPHYYKKQSFILTKSWKKYSFVNTFPNEAEWKGRKMYIRFAIDTGDAFIDDASVIEDTGDQPPYLQESKLINENNINILENPGFELDWQGWYGSSYRDRNILYTGRDTRETTFATKERAHGSKCLFMPPNNNINSKRERYLPGQKYTCSFYAKAQAETAADGKEKLSVSVVTTKFKIETIEIKAQEIPLPWKRYSFSFTMPDYGSPLWNSFYVRIVNTGCYAWLDSFQLEKGELSDYHFTPQIGFQLTEENAIIMEGSATTLNIVLLSEKQLQKKITLSLAAKNLYNDTVWEYRKELPELAEDITRLQVPVENREKGVIGITALLADDQGREITRSHFRYWVIDKNKTVRNPLFGYENRSDVFPVWAVKLTEKIYCEMGAGFQRNFYWGEKYTTFDASSADFLQYLNVKNSLITAPLNMTVINYLYRDSLIAYYNKDYLTKPFALSPDAFKTELTRWGNGFTGILELNKGVITHFEIINELNLNRIKFETAPSKETVIMTADRYIELLKIARACINQTAPKVKIGSCFCRIDLPYIKMLIDAGMLNYIDFLSFHLYQGTPETPPVYEQLAELKSLIQSKKNDLPVYNSEQYFGYRNFLNVWSEYDKAYYSDFEDDYVGRIIQNYLHHSANNIPLALFAAPETAFLPGISSPVYYQYTVGAYRNLSQLLNGIEKGKSLDLKKNLRSFLFERTDHKIIVSFNMKDYGKTGTIIRSPLWEQVLDINGNLVNKNDIDISYLPCYAIYPEKVSSEAVIADVRSLDYFGFNSPFQTECVIARDGTILIRSSNASGKPQSEEIIFESLPAAWSSVPSLQMSNAAPGKWFEKSLGRLEPDRDWRLAYNLQYRESYKDGEDVILKKLPSFDIPFRAGISIDGSLAEWKSARRLLLDENNLSKDFSQGKDKHSGTDDLSAEIALCWDSDNLYIALKVRDNTAMPLAKTAGSLYNNDSVQVYLDLNNDNVSQEFKAYDYNDALYQIGFYQGSDKPIAYLEKNPSGRYIGEANMEKGIDPDVKIAYSKTESGYLYEIAFPATTLPNLLLGSGSELGIDILINDNDGSGRKQALTLGAIGKEPHYNSFLWKSARLIKD